MINRMHIEQTILLSNITEKREYKIIYGIENHIRSIETSKGGMYM